MQERPLGACGWSLTSRPRLPEYSEWGVWGPSWGGQVEAGEQSAEAKKEINLSGREPATDRKAGRKRIGQDSE